MRKILITGTTGFIGNAIIERLRQKNDFIVRAALRSKKSYLNKEIDIVHVGDLGSDIDWQNALTGIDTVIHTAARVHVMNEHSIDPLMEFRKVNVEGTMNLAHQAVQAGVKRFIFISSIKVNGEETKLDKPFTAEDTPDPMDPYGVSKAETEQALLKLATSANLEVVIIRPVLVYGPGVKANFQSMMLWLKRGIPLPLGDVHNKRSLLALDNLVDLIIICIDHPAAANQIFLASDGEDLSTTELLRRVGHSLGKPARLVPVPACLINIAANMLAKRDVSQRLLGSLQVDIAKTRDLLNWTPPVNVDEALQKTAQAFLEQQGD